jgi:predicted peroxiredoxin
MEILIQVSSGYSDSIIPSLFMAMRFKSKGKDVAVLFEWRALIAFAEKKFEYSPSLAEYKHGIDEKAGKMGLPTDPMDYLKGAKAAGVLITGCGPAAVFSEIADKLPPEIQVVEMQDITKPFLEAKKIISGF